MGDDLPAATLRCPRHNREDLPSYASEHGASALDYNRLVAGIQSNVARWRTSLMMCPLLRLANHECQPNCLLEEPSSSDCSSGVEVRLRALRPIEQGSEICWSYLGDISGQPSLVADRREVIQRRWGFACD